MEQPKHRKSRLRKRDRVKRRLRSLRDKVTFYRRATWGAAALVAVLVVALAVTAFRSDTPEQIPLGTGVAGVMPDTTEVPNPDSLAATTPPATATAATTATPQPEPVSGREIKGGEASYYGDELAGNPTATGEPFDPSGMTAAHRTLPLGTRLRVVNPANDREVIVRVNDRGPYHGNRVLDLSEEAARRLGLLRRGRGQVRMFVIE